MLHVGPGLDVRLDDLTAFHEAEHLQSGRWDISCLIEVLVPVPADHVQQLRSKRYDITVLFKLQTKCMTKG